MNSNGKSKFKENMTLKTYEKIVFVQKYRKSEKVRRERGFYSDVILDYVWIKTPKTQCQTLRTCVRL